MDSTILTDNAVPTSYTLTNYNERGWGWWYFPHIELRDEKVVLSTDYLPAGTYVYTYRASTVGMVKVVPPATNEFYFPDVGGRGAGSVFEVKPDKQSNPAKESCSTRTARSLIHSNKQLNPNFT